jgi:hypothetical protein
MGVTEGVGSRFHVLCSKTSFGRYRGHRVPFSSFSLSDSFSTVRKASWLVFMFCAPRLVSGGTAGVRYRFQVLRSRTRFQRYLGRRGSFSCFEAPDSFWAVSRPSGLVFKFCAPRLVFDGTEGVGARFHVLCSRTLFGRYRSRQGSFSCFALPNSFRAVPRASGTVFKFCAPGLVFDGTEGVGACFHVLRSSIRFGRYHGRRVPFSCFALPDSFWALPRAPGPVFMFCSPGLVFGGTEGVGSRFHVLRYLTHFGRYRGRWVPFSCFVLSDSFRAVPRAPGHVFMFCALGHILGGTEGVGSLFHVLRSRTLFGRYRGRRVPFSCFALSNLFRAVPRAPGPVFMFCAPGLVSGGTVGVRYRFQVLRSRIHFRRYRGRQARFHVLRSRTLFGRYRGRRGSFSSFALPKTFLAVPRASGTVFKFCAPGLVFDGT